MLCFWSPKAMPPSPTLPCDAGGAGVSPFSCASDDNILSTLSCVRVRLTFSASTKAMAPSSPMSFPATVGNTCSVARNTGVCGAWRVPLPQPPKPQMLRVCLVGPSCCVFSPPKRSLLRLPCPVPLEGLGLVRVLAPGCGSFLGTHIRTPPARPTPPVPLTKGRNCGTPM